MQRHSFFSYRLPDVVPLNALVEMPAGSRKNEQQLDYITYEGRQTVYTVELIRAPAPVNFGIGIEFIRGKPPTVCSLSRNGPAEQCGIIKEGDQLLSINFIPLSNHSLEDLRALLESIPDNTTATLTLSTRTAGFDDDDLRAEGNRLAEFYQELREHCERGQTEKLVELYNRHAKSAAKWIRNAPFSPLHIACQGGHTDMVLFLASFADVNQLSPEHQGSALFVAVKHGRFKIAEALLTFGALQCEPLYSPTAPLTRAVKDANEALARLLVLTNKEIHRRPARHYLLYVACEVGSRELFDLFWSNDIRVNEQVAYEGESGGRTLLEGCFRSKREDSERIVPLLLRFGAVVTAATVDANPERTFGYLTANAFKFVVEKLAWPKLLHQACLKGNDEFIQNHWQNTLDVPGEQVDEFLAAAIRGLSLTEDIVIQKKYRTIIRFLFDKEATITEEIATECPMQIFKYLQNKVATSSIGSTPSSPMESVTQMQWKSKRLSYLNADAWLLPYRFFVAELNLSNNPLECIPSTVPWELPFLERLVICNCSQLKHMEGPSKGADILNMRLKTVLITGNHRLQAVPKEFFQLLKLRDLSLSNSFISLPADDTAWCCPALASIDLTSNRLSHLPENIKSATNLEQLLLGNNQLKTFPTPWKCRLQKLDISNNSFENLPDGFEVWSSTLQHFNASHNQLTVLPPSLFKIRALNTLCLSSNRLTILPPHSNWLCAKLTSLNLSHNLIECRDILAPQREQRKTSLSTFFGLTPPRAQLSRTPQTSRSRRLSGASALSRDSLSSIQPSCALLSLVFSTTLTHLDLSYNRLAEVPPEICQFTSLSELDLSGNITIRSLPLQLAAIESLVLVKIDHLNLKDVPDHLNPVTTKSVETGELLTHMRSKLRQEEPLTMLKLIVLGEQRSGKTTIVNALTGIASPTAEHRSVTASHDGIQTYSWQVDAAQVSSIFPMKTPLEITIWEFGGIAWSMPMHQCFMANKALYLIVMNLQSEHIEGRLQSRLLEVKTRAPQSSVIVVATSHPSRRSKIDTFTQRFKEMVDNVSHQIYPGPKIILTLVVDFHHMYPLNELKNTILTFGAFNSNNIKIPTSYLSLYRAMTMENGPFGEQWIVTEQMLVDYVAARPDIGIDLEDLEDVSKLNRMLHSHSSVLHYANSSTYWFFTNVRKLGDRIWRLLSEKVDSRKIHVTEVMRLLSSEEDTRNEAQNIFELLCRQEIVLRLSEEWILVPCRLPQQAPDIDSMCNGPIICRVYVMHCQPLGFWSHLLVRLLQRFRSYSLERTRNKKSAELSVDRSAKRHHSFSLQDVVSRSRSLDTQGEFNQTLSWAEGCIWQHSRGVLRVESLAGNSVLKDFFHNPDGSEASEGVMILAQGSMDELSISDIWPFTLAIDELELLLTEWFPDVADYDQVQRYALCTQCSLDMQVASQPGSRISCFPIDLLIACAINTGLIQCPFHLDVPVELRDLIPDYLLTDIPKLCRLEPQKLKIGHHIASGAQGSVYKATYADKDIVVKVFCNTNKLIDLATCSRVTTLARTQSTTPAAPPRFKTTKSKTSFKAKLTARKSSFEDRQDSAEKRVVPDWTLIFSMQVLRTEILVLRQLRHPSIVQLEGVMISPGQPICFALEFAPHGSLANFVESRRKAVCADDPTPAVDECYRGLILDRLLLYKFLHQIIAAVEYIHNHGIIFRDLKCDNILVWSVNEVDTFNIKLSDYGISTFVRTHGSKAYHGTPGFQAPEILNKMTYDEKIDIFSFAMVMYELFTGLRPFAHLGFSSDIIRAVRRRRRPTFEDARVEPDAPKLVELMRDCWSNSPTKRPAAADVRARLETVDCYLNTGCFVTSTAGPLRTSALLRTETSPCWLTLHQDSPLRFDLNLFDPAFGGTPLHQASIEADFGQPIAVDSVALSGDFLYLLRGHVEVFYYVNEEDEEEEVRQDGANRTLQVYRFCETSDPALELCKEVQLEDLAGEVRESAGRTFGAPIYDRYAVLTTENHMQLYSFVGHSGELQKLAHLYCEGISAHVFSGRDILAAANSHLHCFSAETGEAQCKLEFDHALTHLHVSKKSIVACSATSVYILSQRCPHEVTLELDCRNITLHASLLSTRRPTSVQTTVLKACVVADFLWMAFQDSCSNGVNIALVKLWGKCRGEVQAIFPLCDSDAKVELDCKNDKVCAVVSSQLNDQVIMYDAISASNLDAIHNYFVAYRNAENDMN